MRYTRRGCDVCVCAIVVAAATAAAAVVVVGVIMVLSIVSPLQSVVIRVV